MEKMNETIKRKLGNIEIPFGMTDSEDEVSISLIPAQKNHCYITGKPGSGKSVLLSGIINSIVKNYDEKQGIVWSNMNSEHFSQCEAVFKIC